MKKLHESGERLFHLSSLGGITHRSPQATPFVRLTLATETTSDSVNQAGRNLFCSLKRNCEQNVGSGSLVFPFSRFPFLTLERVARNFIQPED